MNQYYQYYQGAQGALLLAYLSLSGHRGAVLPDTPSSKSDVILNLSQWPLFILFTFVLVIFNICVCIDPVRTHNRLLNSIKSVFRSPSQGKVRIRSEFGFEVVFRRP